MLARCVVGAVAVLCCFVGVARGAFAIEPPMIVFKTAMGETMAWVDVVHTGGGPMAVELTVLNRQLDLDGNALTENHVQSGDFTVFPAQIILRRAGERQRVQVLYKSKRKVTADKTYYLFSKEVPLPLDGEAGSVATGVAMLTNYYSVIAFETDKPGDLRFVSSKSIGGGKIEVIAENRGSGRVPVEFLTISVGKEKIKDFTGKKNSVMPGERRRFTFEYARPVSAREVKFGK